MTICHLTNDNPKLSIGSVYKTQLPDVKSADYAASVTNRGESKEAAHSPVTEKNLILQTHLPANLNNRKYTLNFDIPPSRKYKVKRAKTFASETPHLDAIHSMASKIIFLKHR